MLIQYIIFTLPKRKGNHIELVNEYNNNLETKHSILAKTKKKEQLVYTKQNAMDYLIKMSLLQKKNKKSLQDT
jgi:DNA-directed RNA polymerase subunit F